MTEPAVAVIDVTKVFPVPFQRRSVAAVRDLNLEVSSGQIDWRIVSRKNDLFANVERDKKKRAHAIIYVKACLLASLTLFVSTFATTNIFTTVVMVFAYFIGHLQAIRT